MRLARHVVLTATACIPCSSAGAFAQSSAPAGYPTKPIRFIAPFPPGGTSDTQMAQVVKQAGISPE
jgi:tripartite-type tricarboxylate transporter receptor subunit TctC